MKITERLENWARAQRGGKGDGGRDARISNVYALGGYGTDVITSIDQADADLVERAVRRLFPQDREILQKHFIRCLPSFVICRQLHLKIRPASVFDLALAHAKRAAEEKLAELQARPVKPQYESMQTIIDRLATIPLA